MYVGWDCKVKGGNFDNLKGFWDVGDDLRYAFGGYLFVFLVISMTSLVDRIIEKNKTNEITLFRTLYLQQNYTWKKRIIA